MALFQKKPHDAKAAKAVVPAWHPNFRNFERLPDTKTVRTSFFINFGAVVVTLVLALFFAWREMEVRGLTTETAEIDARIDKDKPVSDKAVALYGKFQQEEKRLKELEAFQQAGPGGGKFVFSDFLVHLGMSLPPRITIRYVDCQISSVTLRGAVSGSPEQASGDLDGYIRQLRTDPENMALFEEIKALSQGIETSTGRLVFDLSLRFKDAAAKAAKEKEAKK